MGAVLAIVVALAAWMFAPGAAADAANETFDGRNGVAVLDLRTGFATPADLRSGTRDGRRRGRRRAGGARRRRRGWRSRGRGCRGRLQRRRDRNRAAQVRPRPRTGGGV